MNDSSGRASRLSGDITTSKMYMQRECRSAFPDALLRTAPKSLSALLTANVMDLLEQVRKTQSDWMRAYLTLWAFNMDQVAAIERTRTGHDMEPYSFGFNSLRTTSVTVPASVERRDHL
jgi:hypothetical protein